MSEYLDIIFLLVLVVIIFSRLKGLLGTGSEDTKVIMISKEQFDKMYKEMKKSAEETNTQPVDMYQVINFLFYVSLFICIFSFLLLTYRLRFAFS